MLEFCKCGSLMIENKCSNKNCPHKVGAKSDPVVPKRPAASKKTEPKSQKARRNSRVITYNLYDIEEKEQ